MNKKGMTVGAALILIAILPVAYVQIRLHSHNWEPLTAPVMPSQGKEITSAEFKADLSGTYVVSLEFAPTNSALEECLVGDQLYKDDCASLGSGLDLDWSVVSRNSSGRKAIVDRKLYVPGAFGGSGVVATVLGTFDAQKGDRYSVLLHIRNIAPELRVASPKISVEAGRIYWEKWVIFAQLSLMFAVIPGISGVVLLLWSIFRQQHA
jgi:hypothetical protein